MPAVTTADDHVSLEKAAPEILLPRRRPAQQRSRERFNRILKAARSVLVDVGFESFTFDEVARRAEVPIGTLYQFFANKYVLICELDREDTAGIVSELKRFSELVPALQWPDFLNEFIDHLASLWHDDPSRRAVWHAVQSTPATRATAALTESEMLAIIAEVMRPLSPGAAREVRTQLAGILVHTVCSLLNFAVRDAQLGASSAENEAAFAATVAEIKRMVVAYLFAVATG
ncbi:TetR/AcrR family transcriptional regulator [Corynebacterium aquilae]|uniref:TetR family transcriptional regulator n=1 Tax=Corynebacterium aquilae DSM 44791 TaxID=1431546 RepID=A0A1L7CHF3_9CORY|nr:TetR/AcrR family transcriptional regulator [Corynebacterium aquilae]APT85296.1 TetR family transcriptional regulator [Corynebacterium aquilae DSM 44791]